jgi:hypothetical protein
MGKHECRNWLVNKCWKCQQFCRWLKIHIIWHTWRGSLMAYKLIETHTVASGGATEIEFTGIAQEAGADLVLVVSGSSTRTNSPRDNIKLQFNSVTSGYSYKLLEGTGSSAASSGLSSQAQILITHGLSTSASGLSSNFGSARITVSDYSSSNKKVVSSEQTAIRDSTDSHSAIQASLSTITTGITSIYLSPENGDFVENSTASLYLVTNADAAGATTPSPSATGGTITISGGYWYHTFTSSGTFTPTTTLSCDYVVVGGGGGGWTGGGGGGNVVTGSDSAMNTEGKTVTIGSGGAGGRGASGSGCGGDDYYPFATNGNQSSLVTTNNSTITGGGGGFGGGKGSTYTAGSTGGSGGGGFYTNTGDYAGSSGNGTNANAGGTGKRYSGNNYALGGGGGGAGGVGETPANGTTSGNGGAAYNWNGILLGGGGGASGSIVANMTNTGGTGASGGGNGATFAKGVNEAYVTVTATSGAAGTGSGGGGSPYGSSRNAFYPNDCALLTGGAGGSGIVIIRYAA